MSKHLRGRVTFSNVVALLALFLALGGTVYAAGKLSGKVIKPNSLPANRVKKNSLTGKQLKETAITGVASANALAHVTYVAGTAKLTPADPSFPRATATCPAGQKVLGGGSTIGDPTSSTSFESTATSDHTGWTALGSSSTNDTLTVTAICAPVTATTP